MSEDAAERQYFYYAADGSERNLAADYRNENGMIWQETPGSRGGKMRMFIFFVGTEEQSKTRPHTGFFWLLSVRERRSHRDFFQMPGPYAALLAVAIRAAAPASLIPVSVASSRIGLLDFWSSVNSLKAAKEHQYLLLR